MPTISQATKKLIADYQIGDKASHLATGTATIHVDEVASKVAAFYEKIRGIIDWREEHLLKRSAIERMLKRRFLAGIDLIGEKPVRETIAEPLVMELIRGGHYPNDKIAETKISEVEKILGKYIFILKNTPAAESGEGALRFYDWLLEIAACEIEECLSSSYKEKALIDFMFNLMKERILLNEGVIAIKSMSDEEKNIQIYIAVQKALFKIDSPLLNYNLIKYYYPDWQNINREELSEVAKSIFHIKRRNEKNLNNYLADKFYLICEKYDTPYLLLGDVVSAEPSKVEQNLTNPEILESSIKEAYAKRMKTLKGRLSRAAVYATISIFLTKIFLAMAIEIPIDKYLGDFNITVLLINVLTPPALMLLLVSTIQLPRKENLDRVMMETMKIVYESSKKDSYEVKTFKIRKNFFLSTLIDFIYAITFAISVGVIVVLLSSLKFSPLSITIFLVFISLIAFTGTRIRQRSKELQVMEEKEGFFSLITDLFAIPLIEIGKWLSSKWQKYNFIAATFNILIDMPFMIFVEFIEQWRYFLQEKKEKIH